MVTIRKPKNALKFSKPAGWWGSLWREGLPIGNGVVGASVYGGAASDTVMITHSDLWWQGQTGVLRDVADKLKDVRKRIDDGHFREAENIFSTAFMSQGYRPQMAYPLPLCDFKIEQNIEKQVKEYARVLNMENGECGVTFKDGATRFERSVFVSNAQNIICYEMSHAGAKTIDVKFSLDMHEKFNARTSTAVSKLPDGVNVKYENYFMYFSARSDNGTEFGVVAFINHYGGSQVVQPDGISIKGADRVLVLLKPFIESQREKEWKALKETLPKIKLTYEKLLKEHTPIHQKLFSSCELDLEADGRDRFVNDLLDETFENGEMPPALLEKMWAYGRYLLVTGSKKASRPLAPYGLWCGDYKAEDSQINSSGGMQTIYSHALSGNMAEYLESVFTYYESVIDDLRKNASRIYGARGIFIPSIMAHGAGVVGNISPNVLHFTGVAGWVCQLFYDYYLHTDDKNFLKNRALPFMKEAALFYENFFKVQGDNFYESSPSYSPHTTPGNISQQNPDPLHIAKNSSLDFSIAKELLANLIEGSEIAGANKSEIPKWKDMLTRMPSYAIAPDNTVKEYLDSRLTDNPDAPSTAMFYPVFPGTEVNFSTPELKKSFEQTAKKKYLSSSREQTAASLSRYANIFARLGDGALAFEALNALVRGMSMGNLIFSMTDYRGMGMGKSDIWSQYTIEPNMGVTSCVQEMLVQSSSKMLMLLPALPDAMSKGTIEGLLTRVGVEVVSLSWDKRKGNISLKLKAKKASKIDLVLPSTSKRWKNIGQEQFNPETGIVQGLNLPAGKVLSFSISF
ncbi:MAG: glycoside hydrolase family 95 protein [Firmicutes bacterium]|nr:glycoside hydrolase family 95 protein [Bacillota bacterium]